MEDLILNQLLYKIPNSGANGAGLLTISNLSTQGIFCWSSESFCFKPSTLFTLGLEDSFGASTVFNPGLIKPAANASCNYKKNRIKMTLFWAKQCFWLPLHHCQDRLLPLVQT